MTHDEAFLRDIRAHPDDDAPRLIYADWLEEHGNADRAEFIRLRCRHARLRDGDPAGKEMNGRAVQLLETHWEEWVASLRALVGWKALGCGGDFLLSPRPNLWLALRRFHRGFVESIELEAETLVECGGALLAVAPIRRLRIWGAGDVAEKLAASPHLQGMESLRFVDYYRDPLRADGAQALARSPHLHSLRELDLFRNNVGEAGVMALLVAKWLPGLRKLWLRDCGLGDDAAVALADCPALARLEVLDVLGNQIANRGLRALRSSPHLGRTRVLGTEGNFISPVVSLPPGLPEPEP